MPLYHIRLCGASDGANDPDGEEFASDAVARDHVVASIRAMIADGLSATADCSAFVFELRGPEEQLIAAIPFTAAAQPIRCQAGVSVHALAEPVIHGEPNRAAVIALPGQA